MIGRRLLVAVYNRWLAYRSSRERSVKNIALANDRRAFERIYGSPALVAEYLSDERLAFYDEVAEACAGLVPRRVVDVGCGTGHLLAAILQRVPDIEEVVGVDYAQAAIDRLAEVAPRARGVVAALPEVDFVDDRFDLVVCTEVLEHLERPELSLRALVRLCAENGRIVVTVPDGEYDNWEAHVNFWSASEFETFLGTAGAASVSRLRGGDLIGVVAP